MLCQMMMAFALAISSSKSASVSHRWRVTLAALPMMFFSMADSASPCGAVRQSMMAMWGIGQDGEDLPPTKVRCSEK
jgi:hypothetical protein